MNNTLGIYPNTDYIITKLNTSNNENKSNKSNKENVATSYNYFNDSDNYSIKNILSANLSITFIQEILLFGEGINSTNTKGINETIQTNNNINSYTTNTELFNNLSLFTLLLDDDKEKKNLLFQSKFANNYCMDSMKLCYDINKQNNWDSFKNDFQTISKNIFWSLVFPIDTFIGLPDSLYTPTITDTTTYFTDIQNVKSKIKYIIHDSYFFTYTLPYTNESYTITISQGSYSVQELIDKLNSLVQDSLKKNNICYLKNHMTTTITTTTTTTTTSTTSDTIIKNIKISKDKTDKTIVTYTDVNNKQQTIDINTVNGDTINTSVNTINTIDNTITINKTQSLDGKTIQETIIIYYDYSFPIQFIYNTSHYEMNCWYLPRTNDDINSIISPNFIGGIWKGSYLENNNKELETLRISFSDNLGTILGFDNKNEYFNNNNYFSITDKPITTTNLATFTTENKTNYSILTDNEKTKLYFKKCDSNKTVENIIRPPYSYIDFKTTTDSLLLQNKTTPSNLTISGNIKPYTIDINISNNKINLNNDTQTYFIDMNTIKKNGSFDITPPFQTINDIFLAQQIMEVIPVMTKFLIIGDFANDYNNFLTDYYNNSTIDTEKYNTLLKKYSSNSIFETMNDYYTNLQNNFLSKFNKQIVNTNTTTTTNITTTTTTTQSPTAYFGNRLLRTLDNFKLFYYGSDNYSGFILNVKINILPFFLQAFIGQTKDSSTIKTYFINIINLFTTNLPDLVKDMTTNSGVKFPPWLEKSITFFVYTLGVPLGVIYLTIAFLIEFVTRVLSPIIGIPVSFIWYTIEFVFCEIFYKFVFDTYNKNRGMYLNGFFPPFEFFLCFLKIIYYTLMLFKYPITQTANLFVYFCKKIQKTISYLFNIYFVKNIVINNLTSTEENFYVYKVLGFVETQTKKTGLKPKSPLSHKKIEKIKSQSKKDIKKIKNAFKHIES